MAGTCRRSESASEDMISRLPNDVKDKILGCMNTREAARTALVSTQWKDDWLRHGRLFFDWDFNRVSKGTSGGGDKRADFVKMVSEILMLRSGPVKTFVLIIPESGPKPKQSDLELWCLFLSRNGIEELYLSCPNVDDHTARYKLPVCIFSCQTIKQLRLDGFNIDCPANARPGSVFSGLTALLLTDCVIYMHRGTVPTLPNLEELYFIRCDEIKDFVISAPKLHTLFVVWTEWKLFASHFRTIRTLCLSAEYLLCTHAGRVAVRSFPTAINLKRLYLFEFSFPVEEALTTLIQLLKKCPNMRLLRTLWRDESCSTSAKKTAPIMLEDPSGWFNDKDLCKLEIVKIESFTGSTQEMLFVKAILSNSPALEKLVIKESGNIDASVAFKFLRELLCFPRASPKARIVFKDTKCTDTSPVSVFTP